MNRDALRGLQEPPEGESFKRGESGKRRRPAADVVGSGEEVRLLELLRWRREYVT